MKNLLHATLCCFAICILTSFNSYSQKSTRPNIVVIIVDDGRADSYTPNGAPTWFRTPSINRIADEGANFTHDFCVYSLCQPSRASIMTGLYPHLNEAIDNFTTYNQGLNTFAQVLDSAGYNTAMIGKYDLYQHAQPGWDFWMNKGGYTSGDKYIDPVFEINGHLKTIYGNVTQIINDSSSAELARIDTPFLVYISHQAPHEPAIPLDKYNGIYADKKMPIPSNFSWHTTPYPSYLDGRDKFTDTATLETEEEAYYECLKGVDDNVKAVFNILKQRKLLNKTLILFTSDNGYMFGEHQLRGKGFPYEPSIKMPLFIRYPKWFPAHSVYDSVMAIHVDIPSTLLDVAGIDPAQYHWQGVSLHELALGNVNRDYIMYENIKSGDNPFFESQTPSMRVVRSRTYKYAWYQCQEQTEEFYDLVNDPGENNNLILNADYASLIESYRHILDSLQVALKDTILVDTIFRDCYLVTDGQPKFSSDEDGFPGSFEGSIRIAPNPFTDYFEIKLESSNPEDAELKLYNQIGQLMLSKKIAVPSFSTASRVYTEKLPPGLYLLSVTQGEMRKTQFILKTDNHSNN